VASLSPDDSTKLCVSVIFAGCRLERDKPRQPLVKNAELLRFVSGYRFRT